MKFILRRTLSAFSLYNSLRIKVEPPKWRNTHLAHLTRHLNRPLTWQFQRLYIYKSWLYRVNRSDPRQFTIVILHSNTKSIHIGQTFPQVWGVAGKPFLLFLTNSRITIETWHPSRWYSTNKNKYTLVCHPKNGKWGQITAIYFIVQLRSCINCTNATTNKSLWPFRADGWMAYSVFVA